MRKFAAVYDNAPTVGDNFQDIKEIAVIVTANTLQEAEQKTLCIIENNKNKDDWELRSVQFIKDTSKYVRNEQFDEVLEENTDEEAC